MSRALIVFLLVLVLMVVPLSSSMQIQERETQGSEDRDGDGVSDEYEYSTWWVDYWGNWYYKLSPDEYDSWYDGLSDGQKVSLGLVDRIGNRTYEAWRKSAGDVDGDGLRDDIEISLGLDPIKDDTDEDGIPDLVEITYFNTDPLNNDTDGDGVRDGYEVSHRLVELYYSGVYQAGWYVYDCGFLPEDTDPLNPDTDGDGLSDGEEFKIAFEGIGIDGSDEYILLWDGPVPTLADTDGDGLNDYQELQKVKNDDPSLWVYRYKNALKTDDLDGDGLSDYMEWLLGTNITLSDSDQDFLSDGFEVAMGTSPLVADTDGDGIQDYDEIKLSLSDPLSYDTDGDGLNDLEEIQSYPQTNVSNPDTDGDGLSDYDEVKIYGTDPTKIDSDGDGLNDSMEINQGTNPLKEDSDDDGLTDSIEIEIGTNPNLNDTDGDGLSDYKEWYYGTNPNDEDTDNDNLKDGEEYNKNTDPTNPDTDGDGTPDGSDSDPGTSDYWQDSHYLPSILIYSPYQKNYKPGEYVNFEVVLHGNVGTVNISVAGPGKANVSSLYYSGEGWKEEYINVSFLNFDGNSSIVQVVFDPENADPTGIEFNVINPITMLNVSTSLIPLNFPTIVYFNFTHGVKDFSLSIPSGKGSYEVESITNNSVKVKIKMNEGGEVKVKINAEIHNASSYHREYTFIVGEDKFSQYAERLDSILAKVNQYINVSVNIDDLRQRYYNGDSSALEELKSIIRVETLTLTAAVMISNLVDELASTAVDVISFKTLLNILMDKLKESGTYREMIEYITEKINMLASKIMSGLQVDDDLLDQLVDEITEKAGETLDSTIQEYRDKMKEKFVDLLYAPLKSAHDEIVYQYLSENESKERRIKIYTYAEEGVGMMNLLNTVSAVSESIEETSSIIGSFLNGMPTYHAALEILEKVAGILAKTAGVMEKFEAASTISNIISAYRGSYTYSTFGYPTRASEEEYVLIYKVSEGGDILTSLNGILGENYTDSTAILEQIKVATTVIRFLNFNGSLAMLNSTAERYELTVDRYEVGQYEEKRIVKVDVPQTVIAGENFTVSVELNFNATISLENKSVYGDKANFTLSLSEGNHTLKLRVDDVVRDINIMSVDLSAFNWEVAGDVLYSITPYGILSINAIDYNSSVSELLNNSTPESDEEDGGTSTSDTSYTQGDEESKSLQWNTMYYIIPVLIVVPVALFLFFRRRKSS